MSEEKPLSWRMRKWAEDAPIAQRSELRFVMKAWADEVEAYEATKEKERTELIATVISLKKELGDAYVEMARLKTKLKGAHARTYEIPSTYPRYPAGVTPP